MPKRVLPAIAVGILLSFPAAAADLPATPVALVMELSGKTDPPLTRLTEISANQPIKLEAGAELTFLHYARCKVVTVTGGVVTMDRTAYRTDGRIEKETDGPCPVVSEIADPTVGATTGGLVMRGIQAAPRWPVHLDIVLTGPGADKVRTATVLAADQGQRPLLQLKIDGRRVTEPANSPALPPNHPYKLRLEVSGRKEPVVMSFFGRASTEPASLLVLRID